MSLVIPTSRRYHVDTTQRYIIYINYYYYYKLNYYKILRSSLTKLYYKKWSFCVYGQSHHLDSDDDFRSGCRNVSHHYRQQSFSGLHSPGRSNYTITSCILAYGVEKYTDFYGNGDLFQWRAILKKTLSNIVRMWNKGKGDDNYIFTNVGKGELVSKVVSF